MSPWWALGALVIGWLCGLAMGVLAGERAEADRAGCGCITSDEVEEIVARRLHPTSQPPRWN